MFVLSKALTLKINSQMIDDVGLYRILVSTVKKTKYIFVRLKLAVHVFLPLLKNIKPTNQGGEDLKMIGL